MQQFSVSGDYVFLNIAISEKINLSTGLDLKEILLESPLFNILAELEEGDQVRFAGSFGPDEDDFIDTSFSFRQNSMLEPDFYLRLSSIESAGQSQNAATEQ